MSLHNKPKYQIPELIESLKAHGLDADKPSQLSDAFRTGWVAALAALRSMPAEPVAWGMPDPETGQVYDCISPQEHDFIAGGYTIPLYATPHTAPVPAEPTTDVPETDCGNMQPTPMRNFAAAINNLVAAVSDAVLGTPLRAMPAEPVAWYDVENGQIISAPRWYSDGGRTEAPLYATPPTAPVLTEAWQPISTAPKDGRTLLLGYFNSHGKWRTMRGRWYSLDTIVEEWEESDLAGEGWYETVVESDDYPNCWWAEPTHWMHLPPPPAAALAGDTGEAR